MPHYWERVYPHPGRRRAVSEMDLFAGLIAGAVGTGYLVYAKRQYSAHFAIAGALLIVYPYFFSSVAALLAIGAALAAAPFAYERFAE